MLNPVTTEIPDEISAFSAMKKKELAKLTRIRTKIPKII